MIETATKNAREAAEKFAVDSGSKLGKIRDAHRTVHHQQRMPTPHTLKHTGGDNGELLPEELRSSSSERESFSIFQNNAYLSGLKV